ncbi:MAG: ribosomal RNA small subunit methyltransferase A [Marine Group III euryarchaeote CG-Epi3]|jgi:16S rRNA (adenine1518-N6/adenine1519-N6)-dimethyltransferase|uniref:Probable ribosomal RNA small subunit methyltransferase A n=1 Tax=Marine Group III euryarchaeote CG-Epi3 TaxID=1888997 RepID=A0A1J5U4N9_9ARCH|nr:MAG: ribosomal RNA small subunit methyltransferase A [Marine Group III euryarchaeote CG-Epi3]|tara:strand:- start:7946 stop:8677 length:732 start_codon:yes stop_codon:yes gene_type:complete
MLGQNFLIDSNISKKIVDLAEISEGEKILEIGPGRGALTELLFSKGDLIAVEKDKWLAVVLKQKFRESAEIIEDDILTWDVPPIDVIVANLPYSISSPILFRLFNYEWNRAILMFQEEFANRLVAKPGSKIYGRLSVMANHFASTKKLFKVSKTAFQPQPKIHSQVVKLVRREPDYDLDDFDTFEKVVRSIFTHRRKKIRNCIRLTFPEIDVQNLKYMDLRAENLNPSEIAELSNLIFALKSE